MAAVGWVAMGLLAGVAVRAARPGDEPAGAPSTLLVGVLGAVAGGLVAASVGLASVGRLFGLWSWLLALAGGLLLVVVVRAVATGGAPHRA